MAVNSRPSAELFINKQLDKEISPGRTKVWIEPKLLMACNPVPVIYYLTKNGKIEHPHFMEVPLSSSQGLYLEDVMNRLDFLRGKGMASMYSWSSKRKYRNGYVWQDLTENDVIHPTNSHEYVLKGSEHLTGSLSFRDYRTVSSETSNIHYEENFDASVSFRRRKNQSWSSFDNHDYEQHSAHKARTAAAAADVATQTEDGHRQGKEAKENATELERDETSPPFSNSSGDDVSRSEPVYSSGNVRDQRRAESRYSGGRIKTYKVLMKLLYCGSVSVKDLRSINRQKKEY